MVNTCYLPELSSIEELAPQQGEQLSKVLFFHDNVKDYITTLLGDTYVLSEVLHAFSKFSSALAPLVNPTINFTDGQVKQWDISDKYDVYDRYFEVRRIKGMSKRQFIKQYLDTSAELVNELQHTSMSRGEIAYMLKGWEAANQILLSSEQPQKIDYQQASIQTFHPKDNEERALYRWKLAHHGFAMFMIFSGHCFAKATQAITENQADEVISDWLDKGAHLFRATTGCMEFGNSFTATVYRNVVRTDMSKANKDANLPNGFSGTQNFEYIQWRKQKVELFKVLKSRKASLSPMVMEKVDLLRAYYLEDMHIHSIIAGRMVGVEKSLLQEGFGARKGKPMSITAGDMLRMMAAMREKETAFILEG